LIPAGTGLAYHEERQRKREEQATATEKPELVELSFSTDFSSDEEEQPTKAVQA
jgi:hypothetical protein